MESGCEDFAVMSPFLAAETDEAVTFELANERMGLVAIEGVGAGDEDLTDEVWVGDGETWSGTEPEEECGA